MEVNGEGVKRFRLGKRQGSTAARRRRLVGPHDWAVHASVSSRSQRTPTECPILYGSAVSEHMRAGGTYLSWILKTSERCFRHSSRRSPPGRRPSCSRSSELAAQAQEILTLAIARRAGFDLAGERANACVPGSDRATLGRKRRRASVRRRIPLFGWLALQRCRRQRPGNGI